MFHTACNVRNLVSTLVMSVALANSVPSYADNLAKLSTDFETAHALSPWIEHRPEGFTRKWKEPRIENGHLVLEPLSSGWFEDNQAGHLYRRVEEDFVVTTRLEVRGTKSDFPETTFSLAGLFVRAPRTVSAASWHPGQENWLFFSVGTAAPAGQPQYEVKTTTHSLSTLKIFRAQKGYVTLRLARQGELFTLLAKPEGQSWSIIDQMIRPDLPKVLNVGLTAYADYGSVQPTYPNYQLYNTKGAPKNNADLIARVDWIKFRRPKIGRIPIANLDAPAFIDAIAERRADLTAD